MPDGRQGFTSEWLRSLEVRRSQREREIARSSPVVERSHRSEPLGTPPIQEANTQRIVVRVHSVRKRLLDEDNLCEKFLVDALRYCGFISDDAAKLVKIEVSQEKCGQREEEHVILSVESL